MTDEQKEITRLRAENETHKEIAVREMMKNATLRAENEKLREAVAEERGRCARIAEKMNNAGAQPWAFAMAIRNGKC